MWFQLLSKLFLIHLCMSHNKVQPAGIWFFTVLQYNLFYDFMALCEVSNFYYFATGAFIM